MEAFEHEDGSRLTGSHLISKHAINLVLNLTAGNNRISYCPTRPVTMKVAKKG